MSKYLGPTGLIYLWNKIKNYVAKSITDLHLGDTYVAKESGKGLSTNDYTTAEKNKLSGIQAGAEVNVQSNWAESNSSSDSFIQNKPNIPSKTSDITNDSGYITISDVPSGISDLETIRSGAAAGATAYQKPSTGIPKTDLASAVQTSLSKADTALQSETDPVFSASPAAGITAEDIASWNGGEANVVKSVNTTAGTSGINLSLSSAGALDVTISSGSVASGNNNFVTGGTVYSTTSTLAPKASPALTGTPTAPTATAGTNTTQIATTQFVQSAISAASAGVATFQGDLESASTLTGAAYKKGWYWVVKTAGTYAGEVCEPGDMVYAIADKGSAYKDSDFTVIQTNLDIQEMTTAEMDTATDNWA